MTCLLALSQEQFRLTLFALSGASFNENLRTIKVIQGKFQQTAIRHIFKCNVSHNEQLNVC